MWYLTLDIDGLVQEGHNSSALAMELCLSCTNPLIYAFSLRIEIYTMTLIIQKSLTFFLVTCQIKGTSHKTNTWNVFNFVWVLNKIHMLHSQWYDCLSAIQIKEGYGFSRSAFHDKGTPYSTNCVYNFFCRYWMWEIYNFLTYITQRQW